MPHARPPIDALLCERCGYELDRAGLDAGGDSPCPECGHPIGESDPAHRVGSAWQRGPSSAAYVRTLATTLARPARTLDRLDAGIGPRRLIAAHAVVSASVVFVCLAVILVPNAFSERDWNWLPWPRDPGWSAAVQLVVWPALTAGLVIGLSLLEAQGLRVLAWQRGWRFGRPLSLAIVAHGGVGWVVAAVLGGGGWTVAYIAWQRVFTFHVFDIWVNLPFVAAVAGTLGALLGFFVFETFAWLGLRRCRFANVGRAAPRG